MDVLLLFFCYCFSSRCSDVNKVSSTKIFLPWVYPKNIFVNRFVLDISAVPQKLNIVFLCYKNITFLRQYKYTYQIHSNSFNYGRYGFHLEMNRESRRLFYISRSITVGTWPVEETMRTLWESGLKSEKLVEYPVRKVRTRSKYSIPAGPESNEQLFLSDCLANAWISCFSWTLTQCEGRLVYISLAKQTF